MALRDGNSGGRLASRNPIAPGFLPGLAVVVLTSCVSDVRIAVPRAESDRVTQRAFAGAKILDPEALLVPVVMGPNVAENWLLCILDTGSSSINSCVADLITLLKERGIIL